MDFFDVIEKRCSVRSFTGDPVGEEDLGAVLGAANAAPSAGNLQAYEVVVVRRAESKEKLAGAAFGQSFISRAQVCLVFLAHPARSSAEYGERGGRLYCIQDATIAACHAHLACAAVGLASVWVGAFSDDGVRAVVGAPAEMVPVCVLPIGRAGESPAVTPRRSLGELVHDETLDRPWPGHSALPGRLG